MADHTFEGDLDQLCGVLGDVDVIGGDRGDGVAAVEHLVAGEHVLVEVRHEAIETTLRFYVGRNAEKAAEEVYAAVSGNTSGNSAQSQAEAKVHENAEATASQ